MPHICLTFLGYKSKKLGKVETYKDKINNLCINNSKKILIVSLCY